VGETTRTLESLEQAIARLREATAEPLSNPLAIDGTIQRFEFVIELFWKVLRRALAEEGIEAHTPREALQAAYTAGWLGDEAAWLRMLRDRNETSHAYNEATARRVYDSIRSSLPELEAAFRFVRNRHAERAG
jgi:nucleotidyltransferase substrate binding protein (TIGR01987 family)